MEEVSDVDVLVRQNVAFATIDVCWSNFFNCRGHDG